MKKTILFILAVLCAAYVPAQNPTAYFMDGSTFRSQFNPAFAPQRGYLNLPALGGIQQFAADSAVALKMELHNRPYIETAGTDGAAGTSFRPDKVHHIASVAVRHIQMLGKLLAGFVGINTAVFCHIYHADNMIPFRCDVSGLANHRNGDGRYAAAQHLNDIAEILRQRYRQLQPLAGAELINKRTTLYGTDIGFEFIH